MNVKTKLFLFTCAAISTGNNSSFASDFSVYRDNIYIGGNIGAVIGNASDIEARVVGSSTTAIEDYNPGASIGAVAGYRLNDNIRGELEFTYHKTDHDDLLISNMKIPKDHLLESTISSMGNVYYDFSNDTKITPFVGGGIGFVTDLESNDSELAYQASFGAAYAIDKHNSIKLGYKYLKSDDFAVTSTKPIFGNVASTASMDVHSIEVGYRYSF